ncbi:alpha/beta hydrolase [Actinoplanes sp. TRM 88003]|uniref:Alpha/beta hydrolase n=1 Tax=Paractinoplanes aksuensis TaxID=2939490 RepID=A0ABT1DG32_9ACTN|nr:alpha/beta hydrolase [Actinoplanes aksuensis]
MTSSTSTPKWTGLVPVDDTALSVTDSGGDGTPVIYLNGQFATQGYWRRVVAELGRDWRHVTYDERARGRRSGRSADYSFEAAVRDVGAVLDARGVERALVVGWSYGAFVAAHWASRHPDRTIGAVPVDGAQPHDWLTAEMEQGIRTTFRRLQWLTIPLRLTGLTPRMTAQWPTGSARHTPSSSTAPTPKNLTTAAPWTSPRLPPSYGQDFWPGAQPPATT